MVCEQLYDVRPLQRCQRESHLAGTVIELRKLFGNSAGGLDREFAVVGNTAADVAEFLFRFLALLRGKLMLPVQLLRFCGRRSFQTLNERLPLFARNRVIVRDSRIDGGNQQFFGACAFSKGRRDLWHRGRAFAGTAAQDDVASL